MDCFLIRHAKSQPDPAVSEPEWPLSEQGRAQALALRDQLADLRFDRIYSSPFPRAVDTVAPLAAHQKLEVETYKDLRERKLSDKLIDDWESELEKTWDDFHYRLPGGETSAECQARMRAVLRRIFIHAGNSRRIAVCSHGNAIALTLHSLEPTFRFAEWKKMPNPAVYRLTWNGQVMLWDRAYAVRTDAKT